MRTSILLLALLLGAGSARADIINFDDLAGDGSAVVEQGYHGFTWDNAGVIASDVHPDSGYAAGAVSARNVAYNRDGGTVAIGMAGGFHFAGAWFTSAWLEQELSFEGWRNGQLLYATGATYLIDTAAPQWIGLGWAGIDTLMIYNSSGTQWAMDDFTVPEPGTLALLGACAGAFGLARRRRVRSERAINEDVAA